MNISKSLLGQEEDMLSKSSVARGTRINEGSGDNYDTITDINEETEHIVTLPMLEYTADELFAQMLQILVVSSPYPLGTIV